jgi:outer membrane protein assembly factor BamE (lipoprotein component of BamABCDE complex)
MSQSTQLRFSLKNWNPVCWRRCGQIAKPWFFSMIQMGALVGLTTCLTGCQVTNDVQGTVLPAQGVQGLIVGKTNQDEVLRRLGTPTYTVPVLAGRWYYVGLTRQLKAVTAPALKDMRGYELAFDSAGVLREVTPSAGPVAIAMSKDETDLPVAREDSFFQRIFGGIKRFGSVRPVGL